MEIAELGITAKEALRRTTKLKEGETLIVPCLSYGDMTSFRGQLWSRKKTLAKEDEMLADSIHVSQRATKKRWFICLTRERLIPGAFITYKDGSTKPLFTNTEVDITHLYNQAF